MLRGKNRNQAVHIFSRWVKSLMSEAAERDWQTKAGVPEGAC